MKTISIVGLGYVGLPLAVEFGKQRRVIGYDIDVKRIEKLREGLDVNRECTKSEICSAIHMQLTSDIDDIKEAQIYIITVPTPVDDAKIPDLSHLIRASETVGHVLKQGDIVIFESTVFPGATVEVCVPVLEKSSGLQYNIDFFCGYSPERVNPGDKVNTLSQITKITSGSTPIVADEIDTLYKEIILKGTWKASSIEVAEAAKVIENSQRDLNIAFVNELSIMCNKMDIDTEEVLNAAGSKWNFMKFNPGLVGGHCIGVDPYYLSYKAEMLGYKPKVLLAGREINDAMPKLIAKELVKKMIKAGLNPGESTVGILGITFKENCPDIRNSKVVDLIEGFKDWGINTIVSDPVANNESVKNEIGISLVDLEDLKNLDCLVIAVGHTVFRNMCALELRNLCRQDLMPVIADLKCLFDKQSLENVGSIVYRM